MTSDQTRERLDGLDRFVRRVMRDWDVPGIAVGVTDRVCLIHARGYGLIDIERRTPVTERTLFNICSCSKAFAATTAGILVDEGVLDWDTPVREYMPWFRLRDRFASERVTVRDLLTHRTGLPPHDLVKQSAVMTRRQLIRAARHLEPNTDFRSRFQYNNVMYVAVGQLVEELAGMTWEQFTRERILGPLGMTGSTFANDNPDAIDLPVGYLRRTKRLVSWLRTFERGIHLATAFGIAPGPNGSIYSNVADMCRWLRLQLNGGRAGRRSVIRAATLNEVHTPVIAVPEWTTPWGEVLDASYALGWVVRAYRGHRWIYHPGGGRGFNAYTSFLPAEKLGVVVLANSPSPLPWVITLDVFDRLLGLEPVRWSARARRNNGQLVSRPPVQQARRPWPKRTPRQRALNAYTGEYHHPGYGRLSVSVERGRLMFRYNRFAVPLRHHHDHVFEMTRPIGDAVSTRGAASFRLGKRARAASVAVPMEPAVADIVFRRRTVK